jgi:hypothetical protein
MIPSRPSDDIGDFLAFMALTMGDEAVRARQGARPDDLARFMTLAKLPLPPLYLGYLKEFGAGDGALKMADDANPRVASLIELYEEQDEADPDVPAHGVVIGAFGMSGERALLYPEDWAPGQHGGSIPEPRVVVSWWGDVSHTYAQCFRNHLYRQAFVRGCTAVGAHCSLYRNEADLLPRARQQVETLGFAAHWFSDDSQCCLERDDGSYFYVERTKDRTSLYGCLVDARTRDQIKSVLISALGLRDSTPNG